MANISILSRLVNGVQRNVDLSTNTLVVGSLSTGTNILTDAILGRLLALQNGTDVDATYHTHNTIYYTQTQLAAHASAVGSGAHLIGDGNTYAHITPAGTTVEDALFALDSAIGSSTTADDSIFRIVNHVDATKKIAFSAAGITTGTVRTITMPDSDVNLGLVATALQANGSVTWSAAQNAGGFNLSNLANGVSAQDAVTLSQMQNALAGLDWKQHVRAMADANIVLSGTQTIDSVALIAGDRVLVQNQTTASDNGIYVVAAGAWARSSDASTPSELVAASVYVDEGTVYKGTAWVQTAPSPITIGTTAITFVKFASILPLIFRNGLTQTGQNVDVTPGDTSLTSTLNSLVVNLATGGAISTASGIKVNVSATGGIQISSNALALLIVANTALATGASGLAWQFDNSTIGINGSNQAFVKNAGISATQLATGAFDQSTIVGGAGTAASVQSSPAVSFSGIAGQAFSANSTYAVRFGLPSNSETAGSLYAADITTSSFDLFWVVGFIQTTAAVSIGGTVTVVQVGSLTLKSADTIFGVNDPGKPIFLQSGGLNATTTAPSTAGQAVAKIGIVTSTTTFLAQISAPYVA